MSPKLKQDVCKVFSYSDLHKGDFGVELEIEGDNLPRKLAGWTVKQEGSLRGRNGRRVSSEGYEVDTPAEYVSSVPWTLKELYSKLVTFHHRMHVDKTVVRITDRASTHIHLNMQHDTFKTCLAFMTVFTMVEPVLLRVCGTNRNGNLFCIPINETGTLGSFASQMVQGLNEREFWWPERGKYSTLNTDPLLSFGSFEVRCFPNSIDPGEITRWAEWLSNIRDVARNCDDVSLLSLVLMGEREPAALLRQVFGNFPVDTYCRPGTATQLVQYGAEAAYEFYRALRPITVDWVAKKPRSAKKKLDISIDELIPAAVPPGFALDGLRWDEPDPTARSFNRSAAATRRGV